MHVADAPPLSHGTPPSRPVGSTLRQGGGDDGAVLTSGTEPDPCCSAARALAMPGGVLGQHAKAVTRAVALGGTVVGSPADQAGAPHRQPTAVTAVTAVTATAVNT